MKSIQVTLPRFKPMYGWTNRILRVDLSEGRIWAQETAPYAPDFLGGRGLAAKLVWDEYPEPPDPLEPHSPLLIFPGILSGTIAPYSGRTNVCGFGPQGYPYPWFTRSSIGSDWGARLKRAGYDGLVITGAAEVPVVLLIHDDEVSLLPAADWWGLDVVDTQEAVQSLWGKAVHTLTIGPAGEHLGRIATIQTAASAAAGQGGFGAVMGSKKLKAIAVIGTGKVAVADDERLHQLFKLVGDEVRGRRNPRAHVERLNQRLADEGSGRARLFACTASCPTPCHIYYSEVPGCHFDRKWSGDMACVSGNFRGGGRDDVYNWNIGLRGAMELNMYANRLGLNHWDILVGMIPWLKACHQHGLLSEINGQSFDLSSVEFWVHLLHDMAFREGMGDALADGGWYGARQLDLGVELMRRHYTGWGYSGHWDGHGALVNTIVYPFWIVGALHWAMDTRDPASSTHDYVQNVMRWSPFVDLARYGTPDYVPPISWAQMKAIGERVYGRADTLDPLGGYDGKAIPAAYHGVRSIMKDCLPTDDQVFPLIYSPHTEDRFCRIDGMAGLDVDAAILRAGTGLDWDTAAFEHAAERVLNLERAIAVRHWGRDRAMDERVIPYFEYAENWVNPEVGQPMRLERSRFLPVMDEYYRLRGWDVATGWPTPETLARLELPGVYSEMVDGAQAAQQRLPPLPAEPPVQDYRA